MKHARKKQRPGAKTAVVVAMGAGLATPLALSGTASAATMAHWDQIAQCESGGDWSIDHGDGGDGSPGTGASAWGGGLQFQPASWDAAIQYLNSRGLDTSSFGTHASNSTKDQQILAAEALLHVQPGHPDPWACDPNQILGPSMFDGGANPWGLLGTDIPPGVLAGSGGSSGDGTTPVPDPQPVPVPPVQSPSHVPTSGRWWHHWTVKHGDTLYAVAKRAYGDGEQYHKISGYRSGNPDLIFPGEKVYVP